MARSTGPVLIAGAITAANELIFGPIEYQHDKGKTTKIKFNWRLIPATGLLALSLAGLEKAAPGFAVGLAWLLVATVLLVPLGNAPTPLETATTVLGYAGKVTK